MPISAALQISHVIITGLLLALLAPQWHGYAQPEAPTPDSLRAYPSSSVIVSQPIANEKRAMLESLLSESMTIEGRSDIAKKLCPMELAPSNPTDAALKSSLAITEASIATELRFERLAEATSSSGIENFSVTVDFSPNRVALQHSDPRYPSEAAGVSVPMPYYKPRPVRLEGRLGADIIALIPATRECAVQSVAICARRYTKNETLSIAPYQAVASRSIVELKADALYSPPQGIEGKITVSLLSSEPNPLREPWLATASGFGTLSKAIEWKPTRPVPNRNSDQESVRFNPILHLPSHLAVESRVDIGTAIKPLRTARTRVNIEVNKTLIPRLEKILVNRSEVTIEGGECYLITKWSEGSV